ncbi:hypothetical protein FACS1894137_00820 [Spirochaetia bacterium]|nr:hypothetical protein FACS1894137_00820 [Spirochaetia bacterium]
MAKTIQVRIDDETKSAAEGLFAALGFDISTAIRMFLFTALRENRIPFELKRTFNQETQEAMLDARYGKNLLGPYKNAEEMIAAALGDDNA